jgi:small-conductance mechanosensitive channel
VSVVLGAIISFASSSAISTIVAGIILTCTRTFKLADRIKVGKTTGDVVEKTLLVARIMTIKHVVTIPNSLLMGSQIINFSTSAADSEGVILHTSVTIGYEVSCEKVQSLLIGAALATKSIQPLPSPFVLQTSLDDFYVTYAINAYTKEPTQMATIYSDLHQNRLEKFNASGVEIMSPHYYSVRDGNPSTVPSILNTQGYTSPAFKINQTAIP